MKAVVWRGVGDIRLDDVPDPVIKDPTEIISKTEPVTAAIDAYKAFDKREPGWLKVELMPAA